MASIQSLWFKALRLAALAVLLLGGAGAWAAPSACGAMWGLLGSSVGYFNPSTSSWRTIAYTTTVMTTPNALAGNASNGNLYFSHTTSVALAPRLIRANVNSLNTAGTLTLTDLSAISIPAQMTYVSSTSAGTSVGSVTSNFIVGATFDRDPVSPRLFLYVTSSASGSGSASNVPLADGPTTRTVVSMVGMLSNPDVPGVVSWKTVDQTPVSGTTNYPALGNSGDIYIDTGNQSWIVTNTNTFVPFTRLDRLNLSYSGSTLNSARVESTTTITLGGVGLNAALGSVAVDPRTGQIYIATSASTYSLDPGYVSAPPSVAATLAASGHTGLADAGNCIEPPDPPIVSKSFNPTSSTTAGSTTLSIVITNPNKVPLFLTTALIDSLPSGMTVSTPVVTATSCSSTDGPVNLLAGGTITARVSATAAAVNFNIPSGIMIPGGATAPFGGSCTFSVKVTATLAGFYPNVIPAGSLTTSAGNNAEAATATYQIKSLIAPNPPTITKAFNPTTVSSTIGTTTLTIVVYNPNTITNTFTTALTDNLAATNLRIATPTATYQKTVTCFVDGVQVTRPAATTISNVTSVSFTIANGSLIPGNSGAPAGGSCSFSIRITATTASFNLNTIPAGSLTMVSGDNVDAATASFAVRNANFAISKSYRYPYNAASTTTAVVDVPSNTSITYVLRIENLAGVSSNVSFTDTLPLLMTPTGAITTAPDAGMGACSTSTVVVTGRTRVRGTLTAVPQGLGCTISIVTRTTTTNTLTAVTNTVGIFTSTDTVTSNNTSTVVFNIKPSANLTITKTNNVSFPSVLVASGTTAYTITIANYGPSAANGAVLKDPAAIGLSCTSVTCSVGAGAATCPPSPLISALQTTGLSVPTFPLNSTVHFVVTCDITATGS